VFPNKCINYREKGARKHSNEKEEALKSSAISGHFNQNLHNIHNGCSRSSLSRAFLITPRLDNNGKGWVAKSAMDPGPPPMSDCSQEDPAQAFQRSRDAGAP
jgi:hypothetical protein